MNEPKPQPDENPYLAPQVADIATSVTDRQKPGAVAVVLTVVLGLVTAVIAFAVTFFFTCLGMLSIDGLDNESGWGVVLLVAGLTAVAAFIFTFGRFLKVVRAMKS